MSTDLIETQEDVEDLCRRLKAEAAVGVDTEFLRVRTYYPKLALVQTSTGNDIYCFDPLVEGLRLDALWDVLSDPGICKVMHAARQDMEVLLHATGIMPRRLFDTQVAAGLLGYGGQVGYAALVETEFDVVLPKSVQRTDWTRRPLSGAQLGYAENDVRYLLPLHERLGARLDALGRLDWALEDSERILDPRLYEAHPEQAYRRVGRGAHLDARAQQRLKHLCAWREIAAQSRDLPRHWVVDDETLASIAAAGPRSLEELRRVGGLRREILRRDGEAIVASVNERVDAAGPLWSRRMSLSDEQKALRAALIEVLSGTAAALGIAESVLLTRSDLERLVRGAPVRDVIRGWRSGVIGPRITEVLSSALPDSTVRDDRRSGA
ncbi:MAG: ribonuclease D [Arenicellales bacterium]